ncbi:hypothetical protein [Bacillus norwichensis]|uniref:LysM domain-containing protein n=1 Tax=Bacillus norwichensis TaxID=2762217 RepID=A0ABR8VFM2_9BACI|nr:hypothetical protein [Bacillus norwichensis]MBD8003578.1 hypothetical protein [Bacillus norwichensis]
MKKVAVIITVAVLMYSIYYDLKIGTLHIDQAATASSEMNGSTQSAPVHIMPYEEKKAKSGDTVISIAESIYHGSLPVPIDQLIQDFQKLNNGVKPNEIQTNKEYKFPVYSRQDD